MQIQLFLFKNVPNYLYKINVHTLQTVWLRTFSNFFQVCIIVPSFSCNDQKVMSLYLYKYIDRVATSVGSLDLDPEKTLKMGINGGGNERKKMMRKKEKKVTLKELISHIHFQVSVCLLNVFNWLSVHLRFLNNLQLQQCLKLVILLQKIM